MLVQTQMARNFSSQPLRPHGWTTVTLFLVVWLKAWILSRRSNPLAVKVGNQRRPSRLTIAVNYHKMA